MRNTFDTQRVFCVTIERKVFWVRKSSTKRNFENLSKTILFKVGNVADSPLHLKMYILIELKGDKCIITLQLT